MWVLGAAPQSSARTAGALPCLPPQNYAVRTNLDCSAPTWLSWGHEIHSGALPEQEVTTADSRADMKLWGSSWVTAHRREWLGDGWTEAESFRDGRTVHWLPRHSSYSPDPGCVTILTHTVLPALQNHVGQKSNLFIGRVRNLYSVGDILGALEIFNAIPETCNMQYTLEGKELACDCLFWWLKKKASAFWSFW